LALRFFECRDRVARRLARFKTIWRGVGRARAFSSAGVGGMAGYFTKLGLGTYYELASFVGDKGKMTLMITILVDIFERSLDEISDNFSRISLKR